MKGIYVIISIIVLFIILFIFNLYFNRFLHRKLFGSFIPTITKEKNELINNTYTKTMLHLINFFKTSPDRFSNISHIDDEISNLCFDNINNIVHNMDKKTEDEYNKLFRAFSAIAEVTIVVYVLYNRKFEVFNYLSGGTFNAVFNVQIINKLPTGDTPELTFSNNVKYSNEPLVIRVIGIIIQKI